MYRKPLAIYQALIDGGDYQADPAQQRAVDELERVWLDLNAHPVSNWWARFRGRRRRPVTGLYLWGGVGRGKTWLMDLFFDSLPGADKQRIHFHRFMARVHAELKRMPDSRDPLQKIAHLFTTAQTQYILTHVHYSPDTVYNITCPLQPRHSI